MADGAGAVMGRPAAVVARDRAVAALRADGLTYDQIAAALGLRRGLVGESMRRLRRAEVAARPEADTRWLAEVSCPVCRQTRCAVGLDGRLVAHARLGPRVRGVRVAVPCEGTGRRMSAGSTGRAGRQQMLNRRQQIVN